MPLFFSKKIFFTGMFLLVGAVLLGSENAWATFSSCPTTNPPGTIQCITADGERYFGGACRTESQATSLCTGSKEPNYSACDCQCTQTAIDNKPTCSGSQVANFSNSSCTWSCLDLTPTFLTKYAGTSGNTEEASEVFQDVDGNIGIGTVDPEHTLHVEDAVNTAALSLRGPDGVAVANMLAFEDVNGTAFGWFRIIHDAVANTLRVLSTEVDPIMTFERISGNIGIGTNLPAEKLDVSGNVQATSFIGPLTGNADTATAFLTDPTDCALGDFAASIDANGNLTCSTDGLGDHTATEDLVMAENDIANLQSVDFADKEQGDITVTDGVVYFDQNYATDFADMNTDGGGLAVNTEDGWGAIIATNNMEWITPRFAGGNFSANVSAPTFTGDLTGDVTGNADTATNATTATALAANGSDCPAGEFPLGVDASGNAELCTPMPAEAEIEGYIFDDDNTGNMTTTGSIMADSIMVGDSATGDLLLGDSTSINPSNGSSKTYGFVQQQSNSQGLAFLMEGDDTTDRMSFMTDYGSDGTYTEYLTIVSNTGYVGVNDPTPSSALEVNGTVTATAFSGDGSGLSGVVTAETDPVYGASAASGIVPGDITDWDEAHSWGDHGTEGYLKTEADPVYGASASAGIVAGDITNWDNAHGWGDHSTEGYLTAVNKGDIANSGTLSFDWADSEVANSLTISSGGNVDSTALTDGGTISFDWVDGEVANALTISDSGSVDSRALTDGGTISFDWVDGEVANALTISSSGSVDSTALTDGGTISFDWADGEVANGLTISESGAVDPDGLNCDTVNDDTIDEDCITQNSLDGSEIANDALDFVDLQDTLDLDATTYIQIGDSETLYVDFDGNGDFIFRDANSNHHIFYDNGDVRLGPQNELYVDDSADRVGIGTSSPGYELEVDGDIGANSFLYTSDQSLKDNIKTIENPLQKVSGLRGVTFDWKESRQPAVGFVAQEVEAVIPALVSTTDKGMKAVSYGNITALLVEAVKELQSENDELQSKLQLLEARITHLEK